MVSRGNASKNDGERWRKREENAREIKIRSYQHVSVVSIKRVLWATGPTETHSDATHRSRANAMQQFDRIAHLQLPVIRAQSVPVSALLRQQPLFLHPLVELQTVAMIPRVLVHQVVPRAGNVAGPVGSVTVVQGAQLHHVVHEVHERLALLVLPAEKQTPRLTHFSFLLSLYFTHISRLSRRLTRDEFTRLTCFSRSIRCLLSSSSF